MEQIPPPDRVFTVSTLDRDGKWRRVTMRHYSRALTDEECQLLIDTFPDDGLESQTVTVPVRCFPITEKRPK